MIPTFVDVSGFFTSGSSAAVDLLKEYSGFFECQAEIRFIKDPAGLCDLENALISNWELINSSAAISDFLAMSRKWGRGNSKNPFSPCGLCYNKKLNRNYVTYSEELIDELVDYTYKMDYYHYKFKKQYPKYIFDRWRWAIEYLSNGKIKTANRHIEDCYMCRPTQQKFNEAVTSYIEKIFSQQIESGFTYILLDQAISPNNTQVIHRYFKKAKMIIVTRDPRDMYVDDVRWGENLEKDLNSEEAGLRYALKQKALREGIVIDKDILTISFENLCLEYDNSVKKIEDLIGLTSKNHVTPKKYFKPEVSSKNVGIWKNEYEKYRKAIDKIYEIIPQYCTQK